MSRVLITGVTGQDGAFLAKKMLEYGHNVFGSVRRGSTPKTGRLNRLGITDQVKLVGLELTEFANVYAVLNRIKPDFIYNLAAQSFVADSFMHPNLTSAINYTGVLNILESIKLSGASTRLYQASTSEMYGEVVTKVQDESTPFSPMSPYAVSKLAAHHLVINYRKAYGITGACGILFNHESELRGREFVTRKITSQLAELANGRKTPIQLGNLDSVRDWGYADDYVDGMIKIVENEIVDDFVIATNTIHTVRDFFKVASELAGFSPEFSGEGLDEVCICSKNRIRLCEVNEQFYRPSDVIYLRGDYTKIKNALNWSPKTSFDEMIHRMVKTDLDHVKSFGNIWDV